MDGPQCVYPFSNWRASWSPRSLGSYEQSRCLCEYEFIIFKVTMLQFVQYVVTDNSVLWFVSCICSLSGSVLTTWLHPEEGMTERRKGLEKRKTPGETDFLSQGLPMALGFKKPYTGIPRFSYLNNEWPMIWSANTLLKRVLAPSWVKWCQQF